MDELLKTLLNCLEEVGKTSEEMYDTECRERLSRAIFDGFINPRQNFELPDDFGLYSAEANVKVRDAIGTYIKSANNRASETQLRFFHDRLAAFQDQNVRSDDERLYYDDFFGFWRPETFNELGENIQ